MMASQRKPTASDKALGCGCLSILAIGVIAGAASLVGGGTNGADQSGGAAVAMSPTVAPSPTRTATLANVAGQGLDKVEAQLRASGFTWHAYFPEDTTDDPDQMGDPSAFVVCQQSPAPGEYLTGATTVQLAVVGSAVGCDATTAPSVPESTTQAPAAPQPVQSTEQAQSCYPLTDGGNCYRPGEFCRKGDHGATGIDANGDAIACENNNGWRWERV